MVCGERERKKCRDQQVFPEETKKWICLFYNKLSARQCLCTQVIVVELIFFDTANRGRNLRAGSFFFLSLFFGLCVRTRAALSVCLAACSDASLDAGKHTHVEGICHSAHTLLFCLAVTLEAP